MSTAVSRHPSDLGPVIVMGVSGSGKSMVGAALADEFGVPFIEGDKLHPPGNVEKMRQGIPLTDEDRWPWLDRVAETLRAKSVGTNGALASCSALRRTYRDRLRKAVGPELRFVFLQGREAVLSERMRERKHHFMPAALLASQRATLEVPTREADVVTLDVDASPAGVLAAAKHALDVRRK